MIYYVILAFIDIGMFLSDNWKELTFTAAASGIGVILGKRIGVKFAVNYIMKYMGLQQPTQIEQQVAWLIKQEEMRGNPWNSQQNGQRTIRILSYKRFFLFLHRVTIRKRRVLKMKSYLKKLGKTKFQAFLIITFTNIIMLIGSLTGWVDIDGKINEWMPAINVIVQLIATLVYTAVEGSIDKANIQATSPTVTVQTTAGSQTMTLSGGQPDAQYSIDDSTHI